MNKFVAVLLLSLMLLTGCYNYKEIKDSSVVTAISIDSSERGRFKVGAEFIKAGDSGDDLETVVLTVDCETIHEGLHKLIKLINKNVYLGYCELIIIGDELASNGIGETLNYFLRNVEYRSDMLVFIAKNQTAEELIKGKNIEKKIVGHGVSDSVEADESFVGSSVYSKLYRIIDEIETENASALVSAISKTKVNDEDIITLSGSAYFYKDKLMGYLSEEESFITNLVNNNVKEGNFTVKNDDLLLGVKITKAKSKIKVKNNVFYADLNFDFTINETNKDFVDGKKFEKVVEESVKERVFSLINKMKNDKNSDIFGVYASTTKTNDNFRNYYKDLVVDVNIKATMKGSGISENNN